jgi:hypothetical protein
VLTNKGIKEGASVVLLVSNLTGFPPDRRVFRKGISSTSIPSKTFHMKNLTAAICLMTAEQGGMTMLSQI